MRQIIEKNRERKRQRERERERKREGGGRGIFYAVMPEEKGELNARMLFFDEWNCLWL